MALKFICDNCGKEYPARLGVKGLVIAGEKIEREGDPCPNCQRIADEARDEALARRKKKDA